MNIKELHTELQRIGVSDDGYYLHGLYGSTDDNDKIALTVRRGKDINEYCVYYKERGEKHSVRNFATEDEACDYIFKKLQDELEIQKEIKKRGTTKYKNNA